MVRNRAVMHKAAILSLLALLASSPSSWSDEDDVYRLEGLGHYQCNRCRSSYP